MDIQTSKIKLVKMVLAIENDEFIKKILDFINREKKDFWNDLSVEEQNEIHEGIKQLEQGKRIAYDDFLKKIT